MITFGGKKGKKKGVIQCFGIAQVLACVKDGVTAAGLSEVHRQRRFHAQGPRRGRLRLHDHSFSLHLVTTVTATQLHCGAWWTNIAQAGGASVSRRSEREKEREKWPLSYACGTGSTGRATKPAFVAAVQTKDRWAQRPWHKNRAHVEIFGVLKTGGYRAPWNYEGYQ